MALPGAERQRHFWLRRLRDPLGEGHPCTWRTLLIKVAAGVVVRTRRIVVRLSASWPHLAWYRRACQRVRHPLPTPVPNRSGRAVGPAIAMHSYVGGRGRCIPEADPGRSSVTTAPDAPAAARRTAVLITRSEQEKLQ